MLCDKSVVWKRQGKWGFGAGKLLFSLKVVPFSARAGLPAALASLMSQDMTKSPRWCNSTIILGYLLLLVLHSGGTS